MLRLLEVIRGEMYRNDIFLRKCAIISETIIGSRPRKTALDNTWSSLLLGIINIDLTPEDLGLEVKKRQNKIFRFLAELDFRNNFWTKKASDLIRAPSCSSRQRKSKHG